MKLRKGPVKEKGGGRYSKTILQPKASLVYHGLLGCTCSFSPLVLTALPTFCQPLVHYELLIVLDQSTLTEALPS